MMFCRIAWLVINILGLGIALAEHGNARTGCHNFWGNLIAFGIQLALLWGGGFFG